MIRQCQLFSGLLEGTMSHDDTYAFLVIGRDLERADMTTRVLDVQAGMLIGRRDGACPYADLMWMGVLRSLCALPDVPAHRRADGVGPCDAAISFSGTCSSLVQSSAASSRSPAPCSNCAATTTQWRAVPRCSSCSRGPTSVRWAPDGPSAVALHDYADRLQQGLGKLHEMLVTTYFQMEPSPATPAPTVLLPRMSIRVALEHRMSYRFDRAVRLSPHVVRLRPAPHCRTPILAYSLTVTPQDHFINWQQDPFGNHLARLVFPEPARELTVTVDLVADLGVINPFDFFVEETAARYPFSYDAALLRDLAPYFSDDDASPLLAKWTDEWLRSSSARPDGQRIVDFLVELNQRVARFRRLHRPDGTRRANSRRNA